MAQQLAAVYAQIPAIDCIGRCADSCTSFPVARVEKRIIRRATGVDFGPAPSDPTKTRCPLLDPDNRCAAHAVRPVICRLWGVSAIWTCNFGCKPVGGQLVGVMDTYRLIADVYEISGQDARAAEIRTILAEPSEVVEAMGPTLDALARGRIDEAEAYRRRMLLERMLLERHS